MAVVLPHRRKIIIPVPSEEDYNLLDDIFVVHRLTLSDGSQVLALPHCYDSMKVLGNMGIDLAGCDMFDTYYTPPKNKNHPEYSVWWWQLHTARFLSSNKLAFCTNTPRTGKTLSALMAMDSVQQTEGGACVIIAPLTVALDGEWEKTLAEWFPHKRVTIVHKNRERELNTPSDVYVINPEGVKICQEQLTNMAKAGQIRIAIIDELTEFANVKSKKWIAANAFMKFCAYRWGLTGTPGKPDKIYGQVKIINPDNVPKYFLRWRDMTEVKITQFKWIPKEGHEEVIAKAMSPCVRFDKQQLMKIPVPQVETVEVELSDQQFRMTEALIRDLQVMVDDNSITVATANVLANKLLQVSAGVVKSEDGYIMVDCQPKLEKLVELLKRTPNKKVIFSNYIAVNDMLVEFIRGQGFTCEKIDGSVTGQKRAKVLRDFLESESPHVIICHPRTTAYGVELASADMIICYGPPMAGAFMYQQLFERLSSARQTATETFVVHLSAGRQDKISFSNLQRGVGLEQNIVSIFTRELLNND